MKQKTGIKFCGGCNPMYDRKAYAAALMKNDPDGQFEYAEDGMSFDKLYVICGCSRQCARFNEIRAEKYIIVTNEGELNVE